jgi:hypothetical protein
MPSTPCGTNKKGETMSMNKKVTLDIITDMIARDENEGICFACGEIADSVEPDARNYKCESCGEWRVFGAEEALLVYDGEI